MDNKSLNKMSFISSTSQLDNKPRSSLETIFNIANTMMGTALLVMSSNFYKSGLITSIFAAFIMMLISFFTANLIVIHTRDDEYDYPVAIKRLLGKNWERTFNFISFLLLILVAIIHFILMANCFYSIVINISGSPEGWPKFNDITFNQFSMQWTGVILFVVCGILYSLNDIKILLAINDKGVYMILMFAIYLIYLGIDALSRGNIEFVATGTPGKEKEGLQIILFNSDVTQLISVFNLAFMIHNVVGGMINCNADKSKNTRDLFLAYLIVFFKYCALGIFGSFGVAALYHGEYDPKNLPSNIMELLSNDKTFLGPFSKVCSVIAMAFVLLQLTTVLPILNFFTKRQFYGLFLGSDVENLTPMQNHVFNIVFNILCLGFEIIVIEPVVVIAWTGAIGGFLLIYVIPVIGHLKCLYFTDENIVKIDEIASNDELGTVILNEKLKEDSEVDEAIKNYNKKEIDKNEEDEKVCKECRRDVTHSKVYSKYLVYPFYTIIFLVGVGILVISIIQNIMSETKSE